MEPIRKGQVIENIIIKGNNLFVRYASGWGLECRNVRPGLLYEMLHEEDKKRYIDQDICPNSGFWRVLRPTEEEPFWLELVPEE